MNKIIRYIVENPNELINSSYNASFGNSALIWATQNASRYGGKIMVENSDNQIVLYKSYSKS